ncbi:MAG TPA: alpha/beta hydrolase [Gryllotalpicola sp.]
MGDATIEQITAETGPHYEPYGWHQWPEHPWMSYQFRRALGETQAGSGSVSELFQAASRMIPGDAESWHSELLRIAENNDRIAAAAEQAGNVLTARAAWLRASSYYRSAEFWLAADDPRRLETFTKCENAWANAGRYFSPAAEKVEIPYEDGNVLYAYFLRAPRPVEGPQPVLIAFGGLDSFKEELYAMTGKGALERGISVLLVDGPGQGGTLRREKLPTRPDYEVPVGACIDYLETRDDVDTSRIAVAGSSLGGYYAARAASHEHRVAAAISHGAIWSIHELWGDRGEDFGLADHIKWVFDSGSMAEALEKTRAFTLDGELEHMECPYLIVHGGHDVLGVTQAQKVADYATAHGVDVTFRLVSEEETGAEHCQHDNPTLGMEIIGDWLAGVFGIDQRALLA